MWPFGQRWTASAHWSVLGWAREQQRLCGTCAASERLRRLVRRLTAVSLLILQQCAQLVDLPVTRPLSIAPRLSLLPESAYHDQQPQEASRQADSQERAMRRHFLEHTLSASPQPFQAQCADDCVQPRSDRTVRSHPRLVAPEGKAPTDDGGRRRRRRVGEGYFDKRNTGGRPLLSALRACQPQPV